MIKELDVNILYNDFLPRHIIRFLKHYKQYDIYEFQTDGNPDHILYYVARPATYEHCSNRESYYMLSSIECENWIDEKVTSKIDVKTAEAKELPKSEQMNTDGISDGDYICIYFDAGEYLKATVVKVSKHNDKLCFTNHMGKTYPLGVISNRFSSCEVIKTVEQFNGIVGELQRQYDNADFMTLEEMEQSKHLVNHAKSLLNEYQRH